MFYVLNEDNVAVKVVSSDFFLWVERNQHRMNIGDDLVGDWHISTKFIPGILPVFETMVFGGPNDSYQRRYSSHQGAVDGHTEVLDMVRKDSVEYKLDESVEASSENNRSPK